MEKVILFAKKISKNLTSNDIKELRSLKGVIEILRGYGYPSEELKELTDEQLESIRDEIYKSCM